MTPDKEKRHEVLRRQFNESFTDPTGRLSWSKMAAAFGQVICAYLLLHHTEYIVDRWDALSILLAYLIMPEMAKRIIISKYPVAKE